MREFVIGPISGELRARLAVPGAQAAVLLGLVERAAGLTVLLTERAPHLKAHGGQIAFPGGRIEAIDATPVDAALREAAEEVGLGTHEVAVAGQLPPHITGTGFIVTPVIGFIAAPFVARPDPAEVADVFEVPLGWLLDAANRHEYRLERFGTLFRSFEFHYAGRRIWGATAAMLVTFIKTIDK
jgi:8-oxo-dGTP pyrophosphatase MutT (NUDIX family)